MEKYLYFRTQATLADDDDVAQSAMYPVSSLKGIHPTSDTAITLFFEPQIRDESDAQDGNVVNNDSVVLTTGTNKAKEAMQDLVEAINAHPNMDPFIVVGDDNASSYIGNGNITAVGAITIAAALS
jgi:hypothetical protein|tara:strand:- start:526 stop:903 length:378 start_codon:yes stop_codon:yes gene_type:complete